MTKLDYDPTEPICATTYIRCLESGELRLKAKELSLGQYGSVVTVVSVACTSMSYLLGHLVIRRELTTGFPLARVTDMAEAQVEALKALGATRIALLTPYIEDVSIANALHLTAGAGVDVVVRYTLQLPTDALTTGITPDTIANLAVQITCPTIDVVVIGCSAFRACGPGFISELERRLGKPVITSTQAYLWWMLRVAGVMDRVVGYGRLFTHH